MTIYNTHLLGWQDGANVDNELDALCAILQPHDVIEVAANYRTSLRWVGMPDDCHMIGLEPGFGFTRAGHQPGNLFGLGHRSWIDGVRIEAEGWEGDDTKYGWGFAANGKQGLRFTRNKIYGRSYGIQLNDCPDALFWKHWTEGCMYHVSLQGQSHRPAFLDCDMVGGYIGDMQGDGIKTLIGDDGHGPTDGIVIGCRALTRRNFLDTTGGALRWKIFDNHIETADDEGLDFKSIYTSAADIAQRVAAGTGLNKQIELRGNRYLNTNRAITLTTQYQNFAPGGVSEADHDAACVSDIRSVGETFENVDPAHDMTILKNNGCRRMVIEKGKTLGKILPYAPGSTPDNQGFKCKDVSFDLKWDGEWRAVVNAHDGFGFKFDDGSILKNVTSGRVLLQATRDLCGVDLAGTLIKDASCTTNNITLWRDNGHAVDPCANTMQLVPA